MLTPKSNSMRTVLPGHHQLLSSNTDPVTVRRSVPKSFRLVLQSVDRVAGTPSNNPTFHVDLPRDLMDAGEWALAVDTFMVSGTAYNSAAATDINRRVFSIRLPGIQAHNAVFSTRGGGAASDIVTTMRGPGLYSGFVDTGTLGVRIADKTMFYGKNLEVAFTYFDTASPTGALVPELDAAQVGNETLTWALTLIVYSVDC